MIEVDVATEHLDLLDLARGDDAGVLGLGDVDVRPARLDGQGLAEAADVQRQRADGQPLARAEHDVLALEGPETGQLDARGVGTRLQVGDLEVAVGSTSRPASRRSASLAIVTVGAGTTAFWASTTVPGWCR